MPLIYAPIYSKPAVSGGSIRLGQFTHSKKLNTDQTFFTVSRAIVIIAAAGTRNTPAWYGSDLRLSLPQSGHSGRARTRSERGRSIADQTQEDHIRSRNLPLLLVITWRSSLSGLSQGETCNFHCEVCECWVIRCERLRSKSQCTFALALRRSKNWV